MRGYRILATRGKLSRGSDVAGPFIAGALRVGSIGELEEEQRLALAGVIERRWKEIVARWLVKARAEAVSTGVGTSDLVDGMAGYLIHLAGALRERTVSSVRLATEAWAQTAQQHALNRVRLGFDVTELVRELVLLRHAVVEIIHEESAPLEAEQVALMADLVDIAIAASISAYVAARDLDTRRDQAEHVGFLTHELRNPLSAATMAVGELRRLLPVELRTGTLLDVAVRNLRRLANRVDDVLLVERLDAGKVEVHKADLVLANLFSDVIDTTRQEAAEKELPFRVDLDPSLRAYVDPRLTVSALECLLDNAVKYSRIRGGPVELLVEERSAEIVVHVRDACPGLTVEEMRVIFEPFRRVATGPTGSGLGLTIARRAIEAQGGVLTGESLPDAGCHFWFVLPNEVH